jgi:glyoxylase I family protein
MVAATSFAMTCDHEMVNGARVQPWAAPRCAPTLDTLPSCSVPPAVCFCVAIRSSIRPILIARLLDDPCGRADLDATFQWLIPLSQVVTSEAQVQEVVMNETHRESSAVASESGRGTPQGIIGVHGVRYQVKDVARAAEFYTDHLGFRLEHQQLPAFASVSLGEFTLLLSGPGASGSRSMPGGGSQEPGGWNRVVLRVADLPAQIDALKKAGVRFRNELEAGPGGRQIQVEDPDGNPIELFEPAR